MKIMLIDPPGEQKGINVGLAYLSGSLFAAGIEHVVWDMVNVKPNIDNLIEAAIEYDPQCFGISMKTATYLSSIGVARKLKEIFPQKPIVAGGPHATLYSAELLSEVPQIDAIIGYDAEKSLVELLSKWDYDVNNIPDVSGLFVRKGGEFYVVPPDVPRNLDELPFPTFDKFHGLNLCEHPYPLVTSRGCPHGCIYCTVGKISGRKWRYRSPTSVVEELERAKDRRGIFEFDVLDDTFTQDVARAVEICRLIIDRKLNMKWSCPNGIRADRVTSELLGLMVEAGCQTVIFGVESANPDVFASLRKGEILADVENAVKMAKSAGLRVGGYFIIGLPGDTFEGTISSLEYAKKIGLDWAHFNILAPYPGAKVWDIIKENGRFLDDWKSTRHFGAEPRPIFELENYSADDMVRAYRTAHVRQGLYHLILPAGLDEKKKKSEIRKLRIKYDREVWKRDVVRDATAALLSLGAAAKIAFHEAKIFIARKNNIPSKLPQGEICVAEKLRVLMVNDHGGAVAGTEKYINEIMLELKKRNIDSAWVYEREGDWRGIEAKRYEVRGLWNAETDYKIVERGLNAAITDFKPNLIHVHNIQSPAAMKICVKHAPTIRTVHDHNFTCPSMNRMLANGRICVRRAGFACAETLLDGGCMVIGKRPLTLFPRIGMVLDGLKESQKLERILVTTQFMREELTANGIDPGKIMTVPLFVDFPNEIEESPRKKPLRILWAGRMVIPDKGPDVFIEVLSYLKSPYKAIMAGTGPSEYFVRKKAIELGVSENVEFAGKLNSSQMEREYRNCDLVAFTSVWPEPFGYVGVEAASYGKPVVAFDVGGVGEWLVDGEGGYVVSRVHNRAMAIRIDMLAKDPELRARMGALNRHHAMENFNRENHTNKLITIYREAAAK